MKYTDLPSPGLISQAGPLRSSMAQAISYVQTMAAYSATGKSKHAQTLAAFLTAAQVEVAKFADSVVPAYGFGSVDGAVVRLVYSEDLTGAPKPAAFTVLVATVARTVTAVSVGGKTVTLTLATPVTAGQAVTVAYAVPTPAAQQLADASGNPAAARAAVAITNSTV